MNQQVKYMLQTYESFIIHSLIIIFIIQPSPSKNHHRQTCNRATLRSFSVKKIVVRMKNVKFRGIQRKKTNAAVKFRGSKFRGNANSADRREIPRSAEKLWALFITLTIKRRSMQQLSIVDKSKLSI